MNGKLTKQMADSTERNPGRNVFVWDREPKGFGLRVKPSGGATFVIQYVMNGTRAIRRLTVPEVG